MYINSIAAFQFNFFFSSKISFRKCGVHLKVQHTHKTDIHYVQYNEKRYIVKSYLGVSKYTFDIVGVVRICCGFLIFAKQINYANCSFAG